MQIGTHVVYSRWDSLDTTPAEVVEYDPDTDKVVLRANGIVFVGYAWECEQLCLNT